MRKSIYYLLTFIFLFIFEVQGQEKWTLDDCIKYAIENNLDIQNYSLQNKINKENLNQSKRNLLPSLSMSASASNSFGRSLDYDTYEYVNTSYFYNSLNISSGISLFRGFVMQNTISYRKLSHLAGIEDEKQQKNEIAFSVMEIFFNTLYYNGYKEIALEQKDLSELNLKQTRKQVDLGMKAKVDLVEMESRLAREELILIQAQNVFNTSLLQLKQALNLEQGKDFDIDLTPPDDGIMGAYQRSANEVFAAALENYPLIKAASIRLEAAKKNLAISKGWLWPSLSMSAGYGTNYSKREGVEASSYNDQFKNNAGQSIGLSLNIPIFDRFGTQSDIKIAKLSYQQAETSLQKTSQQLYNEINTFCQDLDALYSEYEQLTKQVEFARIAYDAAVKKMDQGLISVIELYDSKNVLAQAQSNLLNTKLKYILKKKTIDFFLGEKVFGFSIYE